MTPTALFDLLKKSQTDFDINKVESFKRLDSGAFELPYGGNMDLIA